MAIRIVPYEATLQDAAREFDARMRARDALPFAIGDAPRPAGNEPRNIRFQHFLAVDSEGFVRGGYFIRTQPFLIRGSIHTVGHYSAPLSEGIVDRRFAAVGPMMLAHALKQQPLLFAMGMGGVDRPLPRMLKSMGWAVLETPFYFRILNARRFLRNAGPLQTTPLRRFGANALALSGLGSLGIFTAQRMRTSSVADKGFQRIEIDRFDDWADSVWQSCSGMFSMSAVRDSSYLGFAYPASARAFHGFRLEENGKPVAWAELLDCKPGNASYFGSMKVMALVDGVGPAAAIPSLIAGAMQMADEGGADLLFSNQMHVDWTRGLRKAGFWPGPSNYLLALSKELTALLEPLAENVPRIHFNRGDGDGVVNLIRPASGT